MEEASVNDDTLCRLRLRETVFAQTGKPLPMVGRCVSIVDARSDMSSHMTRGSTPAEIPRAIMDKVRGQQTLSYAYVYY